jgi:hypothetical protein
MRFIRKACKAPPNLEPGNSVIHERPTVTEFRSLILGAEQWSSQKRTYGNRKHEHLFTKCGAFSSPLKVCGYETHPTKLYVKRPKTKHSLSSHGRARILARHRQLQVANMIPP